MTSTKLSLFRLGLNDLKVIEANFRSLASVNFKSVSNNSAENVDEWPIKGSNYNRKSQRK